MKFFKSLATFGPIGYLQASGTFATVISLPIAILLNYYLSALWYIMIIAFSYVIAHFIIKHILPQCSSEDPSEIVIDEFIGTLVTFLAIPLTPDSIFLGLVLFRFFDISKIGLHWIEDQKTAHAIILDDVIAGLFANLCLHILFGFGWI